LENKRAGEVSPPSRSLTGAAKPLRSVCDVCGDFAPLGADLDNLGKATLDDSTVGVIGP
jgi:hypothetical protein